MKFTEEQYNIFFGALGITFGVLLIVTIFGAIIYNIKADKERNEQFNNEFVKGFSIAIQKIDNIELKDAYDHYDAIFGEFQTRQNRLSRIQYLLKRTKMVVVDNYDIKQENQQAIFAKLKSLINTVELETRKEAQLRPFSEVPTPERELLLDIYEHSEIKDKDYLLGKFSELGNNIKVREETINRISDQNETNFIWTVAGAIGTAIFGFLSLFLGIRARFKSKEQKDKIDKFNSMSVKERISGLSPIAILESLEPDAIKYFVEKYLK